MKTVVQTTRRLSDETVTRFVVRAATQIALAYASTSTQKNTKETRGKEYAPSKVRQKSHKMRTKVYT